MKKYALPLICALLLLAPRARADEGMWIPTLIGSRIKDMKAKGSKLTAEDIYSVNKASLKDAVVIFGGGCTGEVVSDQGLMFTNHHCGYYFIGAHSTVEHDYLTNGFWAMDRSEELPNPGLDVRFLIRMDEVTDATLQGVSEAMPQRERDSVIRLNTRRIVAEATEGTHYEASVEPFYYGNQYFLFIYEKFIDIRLVAAPPSSIGKFGGDTDNWMWPRHTGDFAVFRIYAGPDNKPAAYSPDNVPFTPRKSFTLSTKPLKAGDFTMVYGNPGRTVQYVVSDQVDYTLNHSNPAKIRLRTKRLEIMNAEQAKDPAVRIAYAAKNARVSNSWKRWQGESKGLARLRTIEKKQALEARFADWAADKPEYADLLPRLRTLYAELLPYAVARDYHQEAFEAIELTAFANGAAKGVFKENADRAADGHFKNYSRTIDILTTKAMLEDYYANAAPEWMPTWFRQTVQQAGDTDAFTDNLFTQSAFSTPEKYAALFRLDSAARAETVREDPAVRMAEAFTAFSRDSVEPRLQKLNAEIAQLYRLYMRGLMEMQPGETFFPDANRTLRVSYGQIEGYQPLDAVWYKPFSTIDGIIEKDNPDIYDYDIPQRLRDVYTAKDYGRWAVDGTVPVCFLATNHTSGGNSGSPVLNGRGELIGINFDRTWESTMSDYEFDPKKCRNVTVDIRYVLFVIDKIGGAGYLIDEMKLSGK